MAYLDRVDQAWTGQLHGPPPRPPGRTRRPAGRSLRRAGHGLPPRRLPRLRIHQRRGGGRPGSPAHERTVAHKQWVLAWLEDLAERAGAEHPDRLARALALLLDGALAGGALTRTRRPSRPPAHGGRARAGRAPRLTDRSEQPDAPGQGQERRGQVRQRRGHRPVPRRRPNRRVPRHGRPTGRAPDRQEELPRVTMTVPPTRRAGRWTGHRLRVRGRRGSSRSVRPVSRSAPRVEDLHPVDRGELPQRREDLPGDRGGRPLLSHPPVSCTRATPVTMPGS